MLERSVSHIIAMGYIPVLDKLTSDLDLVRTWIEDNLDLYKASLSGLTLAFDLTICTARASQITLACLRLLISRPRRGVLYERMRTLFLDLQGSVRSRARR